ncbi:hypothetical protein [Streptomyces carpaticus]|uniref:Uncharacterized protein n=1 Tax=Streptomyces carpaticus TaxID=285558 RepID=A0ABV4ZRQ6_9ACTN
MGKYVDDGAARHALEAADRHAGMAGREVPYRWDGSSWRTPGGEWRDFPLIRRGMGEWFISLVDAIGARDADADEAQHRRDKLERQAKELEASALFAEAGAVKMMSEQAAGKRREAASIEIRPRVVDRGVSRDLYAVARELLSATDTRATQLLSLASQFDAFRAPMRDPSQWVARLGSAPRNVHVRTSAAWEAFGAAEPALSASLGVRAGKRLLFAAMDRRFGARRKLAGHDGWRGVALPD